MGTPPAFELLVLLAVRLGTLLICGVGTLDALVRSAFESAMSTCDACVPTEDIDIDRAGLLGRMAVDGEGDGAWTGP